MLSLFKKMFSKGAPELPAKGRSAPPAPARETPAASRPAKPAVPTPACTSRVAAGVVGSGDSVKITLSAILSLLPKELAGLANPALTDGVKISIPANRLVEQLAQGSAKISFAELCQLAPPGAFRSAKGSEGKMLDLPLGEILTPRLDRGEVIIDGDRFLGKKGRGKFIKRGSPILQT